MRRVSKDGHRPRRLGAILRDAVLRTALRMRSEGIRRPHGQSGSHMRRSVTLRQSAEGAAGAVRSRQCACDRARDGAPVRSRGARAGGDCACGDRAAFGGAAARSLELV